MSQTVKERLCNLKVGNQFRFFRSDPISRVLEIKDGKMKIMVGTTSTYFGAKSQQWVWLIKDAPPVRSRILITDEIADIIKNCNGELTIKEMCRIVNLKYDTVYKYCSNYNIPFKRETHRDNTPIKIMKMVTPTTYVRPPAKYTNEDFSNKYL